MFFAVSHLFSEKERDSQMRWLTVLFAVRKRIKMEKQQIIASEVVEDVESVEDFADVYSEEEEDDDTEDEGWLLIFGTSAAQVWYPAGGGGTALFFYEYKNICLIYLFVWAEFWLYNIQVHWKKTFLRLDVKKF